MFAFDRAMIRACGTGAVRLVLLISLAALVSACSSTKQPAGTQVFAWLQPEPAPPAAVVAAEVELEDDGSPSQTSPPANIRQMLDDPTAPWSPNYGRSAAGMRDVEPAKAIRAYDSWQAVTRPVTGSAADGAAAADSDGFPLPKSPEEAGVSADARRPQTLSNLRLPVMPCGAWNCTR